ncbi:MAG: ribonuclease E/G [Sphingobium sp. 66-54]|nr:MAG: ribonuclease E/G [Sphingobium sp. 66-54]
MLIDARHREETRVAVVTGNRIEEFDFESAEHKQLKGNIYLAKVTRVEPSLQAAFVDYGGNRHGFLAFSEIHPDYYQIPREDREALLAEEAQHAAEEAALRAEDDEDEDESDAEDHGVEVVDRPRDDEDSDEDERADADADGAGENDEGGRRPRGKSSANDQAADELRRKRMALRRRYKIQDVIKRRQVLLVQVVKEERGNKGAALTTYLSLAGRYCVLMPNTSHGGGISRKISNGADRKRLKSIIAEMKLPSTMGCIVRTAGLSRTKTEIRRDFDYLARLWDEIRENTLRAAAPALIHNDSDLIKRAIRDIYHRDIEEVVVEGEEGYRAAKDFMKLLMPSHARRVKQYADPISLFQRYGVEDQLAAMYNPVVQLKSGGYLVINPTEALVSIDINSGRSTREHNIEQTAFQTNLEAAREIARQLRLRDMAGLIVIDFIDMEHNSNIRKVEKAMKEALKDDRARIQVGRISGFGLMEMSRQRLRTGVLEASTRACPHCEGTGLVRTASSAGLSALRMLEEEAARGRGSQITLRASQEAAFYVLNNKRRELDEIEQRYGVQIAILPDGAEEGARMSVEASGPRPAAQISYTPIIDDSDAETYPEDIEDEEEEFEESAAEGEAGGDQDQDGGRRRKRRRRGRRGRRDGEAPAEVDDSEGEHDAAAEADDEDAAESTPVQADGEEAPARRNRRGRRGGRRRRGGQAGDQPMSDAASEIGADADSVDGAEVDAETAEVVEAVSEPVADVAPAEAPAAPARRRRVRRPAAAVAEAPESAETPAAPEPEAAPAEETVPVEVSAELTETPAPKRSRRRKVEPAAETEAVAAPVEIGAEAAAEEAPARPKRPRRRRTAEPTPEAIEAESADRPAVVVQEAEPAVAPEPAGAESVDADEDGAAGEQPRRGWWQRTFGA